MECFRSLLVFGRDEFGGSGCSGHGFYKFGERLRWDAVGQRGMVARAAVASAATGWAVAVVLSVSGIDELSPGSGVTGP